MAKTRIQFKTDKTANWSDSFAPLAGELCIFSDYEETEKTNHLGNKIYRPNIKIGKENKVLSELSFLRNESIFLPDIYALFYGVPNLVPFSVDTDGTTIYNNVGYIEGYRLSSSGDLSTQANTVTTGYIPCKSTDIIQMSGLSFLPTTGYNYLSFYDNNFTLLGSINIAKHNSFESGYQNVVRGIVSHIEGGSQNTIPTVENGVTIFDHYSFNSDADQVAYFRVNGQWNWEGGSGAEMIVTKNYNI